MLGTVSRGVLFVHSVPRALCQHVEWAVGTVLDARVQADWSPQPVTPGSYRTEISWQASPGTGARLTSSLRGWDHLRYEVTEEPAGADTGSRWSYTPTLGIHHATIDAYGNALVPEDVVRSALASGSPVERLERALGLAWDVELEPFRHAGEEAPVRWLHRVG